MNTQVIYVLPKPGMLSSGFTGRKVKMSKAASETNPEIQVNGEQQDQTPEAVEQISVTPHHESTEDSGATEKETHAKVHSVFEQVRAQIRSQGGIKVSKSSMLELVQKIKDREIELVQEKIEPDGNEEEEIKAEGLTDGSIGGLDLRPEMHAFFDQKLETAKNDLKKEFDVQISLVRKEMQTYTDQALKDLECKMQSLQAHSLQQSQSQPQQEGVSAEKQQKPSAAPSLVLRRRKVLTRTMTTIIPKTSAPIITGPRAKSEEFLSSSKGQTSQLLLRDPMFLQSKTYQSRNPLPPARAPLHQRKKSSRPNQRQETDRVQET